MTWDEARTKWFIASMEAWMGLRKDDPPEKFDDFKRKMRRRDGTAYDAPLESPETVPNESGYGNALGAK